MIVMKSYDDAEGAQDFLDDSMRPHLAIAYTSGFRVGAFVGMFIGALGTVILIQLLVSI